eukprot:CAMPEP_0116870840 /NCGR_PEP_ID=MMETSP0463-20121206/934_1 /TAXON_ID=181622 /ORGANISM="Strombidinopsis sp, Strain SopsisLIS2011" /LENGTH=203 /DNA_ID=CAMNT_0004508151 /DNA_START=279 /DNA_END=890 /DNA_ORIENTATION=+
MARELRLLREQVSIPFLPPLSKEQESRRLYTLVLDLDETLIHFDSGENEEGLDSEEEDGFYMIRPSAVKFLSQLKDYYEIVIFTAAMPDYADWILKDIDTCNSISHRLYRQHTTPKEDYAVKDLAMLGRSLERTIIIDNLAENFNYTTPANGIWVESWYDDMDDNVLDLLIPFLKEIVTSELADVRDLLEHDLKERTLYKYLE